MPWEAELIKNIPVSEGGIEDLLLWPLSPDGHYSVRSAYHMLSEDESRQEPGSSSSENSQQVWKSIWKIRTPNKIRHFIWRAARDSLPTKQNLRARHLPVEETCELCGDHQESLMHSIWLCEHAQAVWKSELCFVQYYRKGFRTFFDFRGGAAERVRISCGLVFYNCMELVAEAKPFARESIRLATS